MKRSPQLAPLSRDHHVALTHALRLRRAAGNDVAEAVAGFLAFFATDGNRHFEQEERFLAPAIPDSDASMRERLLAEHEEIRGLARELDERPEVEQAHALGERLAAHVRFEERELFPLLEAALPADELGEIGRALHG